MPTFCLKQIAVNAVQFFDDVALPYAVVQTWRYDNAGQVVYNNNPNRNLGPWTQVYVVQTKDGPRELKYGDWIVHIPGQDVVSIMDPETFVATYVPFRTTPREVI